MIEKFTKEEIAIIREELKNLPKSHMKRDLCAEQFKKLRNIFSAQKEYKGIYNHEVEDAILLIADHVLCNYEVTPSTRKQKDNEQKYRRAVFVNDKISDSYKAFVDELIGVMYKYIRKEAIEE